jgi:hypothetical protein
MKSSIHNVDSPGRPDSRVESEAITITSHRGKSGTHNSSSLSLQ